MAYLPMNAQQLCVDIGGIGARGKEVQDGHVVSVACH